MSAATDTPCPDCGCADPTGSTAHAIRAALVRDDLDAAIEAGLLDCEACGACTSDCRSVIVAARDARHCALAARERYRARNARLQRRAAQREARRNPSVDDPMSISAKPALPPAAAAALARAKARAAGKS